MARYFQNPTNGYVEKATGGFTWLWAFLFGPLYYVYKGAWPAAFVYLLLVFSPLTGGNGGILIAIVLWVIFAIAIYPAVDRAYRRAGWIETTAGYAAGQARSQFYRPVRS